MRTHLLIAVCLLIPALSCTDSKVKPNGMNQCEDGKDNDGDGMIDFPDDPGCISSIDDSEDSAAMAQCSDGRDNDMDGFTDYPSDPGCFAPQQDDELDDCPTGPNCPQCGNGIDDDGNGMKDFPNDPGCISAADNDEFTHNPAACGAGLTIKQLPGSNTDTGTFTSGMPSMLMAACGGGGGEVAYELRLNEAKVVVASTDNAGTTADTVLYIRGTDCSNVTSEMACSDDVSGTNTSSTITVALQPGLYYLIVDAHDNATSGEYDLSVQFFVGEGTPCASGDDCGPGLVCRVPLGDTVKKCSKHVCNDGVDDDADGKNDYPQDPGCLTADDDDEADTCPAGPGCPECADGIDNDNDGMIDFPLDLQCQAASSSAEACISHEPVAQITAGSTPFTTTGATSDFNPTCSSSGGTAPDTSGPDLTYRLDLPATSTLTIDITGSSFDYAHELLNTTCGGVALACSDFGPNTVTNLAAGTYYVVVDGYFTTSNGAGAISVSGKIAANASCEGALAVAGVLTCGNGYACKGSPGARICGPALCNDGIDNDTDGKIDYPADPGCDSPADDTENDTCPGAGCPVCSDGTDNDADGSMDYPGDYGCSAASGTTEVFCMPEHDPTALIVAPITTGTTTGLANDLMPGCSLSSTAPDKVFALSLPVTVATMQIDTINSSFDTQLSLRDATCGTLILCDDDGGGSLHSLITQTNMAPGNYAIEVDGYSSSNGAFTLNVKGTVATGTACTSPLFAAGVLLCPAGTTCNGGTCH